MTARLQDARVERCENGGGWLRKSSAASTSLKSSDASSAPSTTFQAALVLEGSPGIGKTVLWRAGLDLGRARDFRGHTDIPAPAETRLSLSGMVDLLAPVLADVLPALPAPQRRALEVSSLLLAEPEGSLLDARALDAALLGALHPVSRLIAYSLLWMTVQWLDGPSAAALSFAVRRLRDEPDYIALLLTRRLQEGGVAVGCARPRPRI